MILYRSKQINKIYYCAPVRTEIIFSVYAGGEIVPEFCLLSKRTAAKTRDRKVVSKIHLRRFPAQTYKTMHVTVCSGVLGSVLRSDG